MYMPKMDVSKESQMKSLSKEDLYKITIVFFVFFIIVLITFFSINRKENEPSVPFVEPDEKQFTRVTNYNIFYFVDNNINTFITYIIEGNNEGILNFLDEDYKKEKNITLNNINMKIPYYKEEDYYKAKLTNSFQINEDITVYYTEGDILNEGFDGTTLIEENVKYLLYVDYENMVCSIELIDEEKKEEDFDSTKTIPQNSFNQVKQIELISTERICSIYLADYFNKIATNEAYKYTTNYNSLDKFQQFYEENNLVSEITSCVQNFDDNGKRVYIVIDKNNYCYHFTEKNILDYTVSITK